MGKLNNFRILNQSQITYKRLEKYPICFGCRYKYTYCDRGSDKCSSCLYESFIAEMWEEQKRELDAISPDIYIKPCLVNR